MKETASRASPEMSYPDRISEAKTQWVPESNDDAQYFTQGNRKSSTINYFKMKHCTIFFLES